MSAKLDRYDLRAARLVRDWSRLGPSRMAVANALRDAAAEARADERARLIPRVTIPPTEAGERVRRPGGGGTLPVVEEMLRKHGVPMSPTEIAAAAGVLLPTTSRTPQNIVARDLSCDVRMHTEASPFVRVGPGKYALKEWTLNGGGS